MQFHCSETDPDQICRINYVLCPDKLSPPDNGYYTILKFDLFCRMLNLVFSDLNLICIRFLLESVSAWEEVNLTDMEPLLKFFDFLTYFMIWMIWMVWSMPLSFENNIYSPYMNFIILLVKPIIRSSEWRFSGWI